MSSQSAKQKTGTEACLFSFLTSNLVCGLPSAIIPADGAPSVHPAKLVKNQDVVPQTADLQGNCIGMQYRNELIQGKFDAAQKKSQL